jgi:hypothetical protein
MTPTKAAMWRAPTARATRSRSTARRAPIATAKDLAIEATTLLKTKNVHAEVTVRDLETGEKTVVKHPLQK